MPAREAPFDSSALLSRLRGLPRVSRYLVGFSGGVDSTALLLAMSSLDTDLDVACEAVHFNHGLHPQSEAWEAHCKHFCQERGIPLTSYRLDLSGERSNLESRARSARYSKLEELVGQDTGFLTAHNLDDRAETFLLHALRGSGPEGLASIPFLRPLGRGWVARPLLDFSRESLREYLESAGVGWVEDPSNQDTSFDRNFIRHEVLPLLESRWPAARHTLARTAGHLASASGILSELIAERVGESALSDFSLPLETMNCLGSDASGVILREWLQRRGVPSPPEARLREFLGQLESALPGAHCTIEWGKHTLRLYRDELRLEDSEPYPQCPISMWDPDSALGLGPALGQVRIDGPGFPAPDGWCIGPRLPGKSLRLNPAGPARKLKKLLQEQPIPKWQRLSIPVLYSGDRVLAIGDWLFDFEFASWLDAHRLVYRWEPAMPALQETRAQCHQALQGDWPA